MVKINFKRTFALLAVFVIIMSVFAVFCGRTSYALSTDDGSDEKPPAKVAGTYGTYAVLADYDNCLTESEENELLEILHTAAEKAQVNVAVVITKDLEGKSDERYIDTFLMDHFGVNGGNSVGLLLLNRYGNPKYSTYTDVISAYGAGDTKYRGKYNRMFDRIYDKMGDPIGDKNSYNVTTHTYGGYDYFNAIKEFANCVKRYGATGLAAIPMFFLNYITGNFMAFFGGIVLSVIITLIVVSSKVHSYKRKATLSASNYMDRNATRVTRQVDQFVREYTTSHTHSSSSGGGGGHHGGGGHSSGHGRGR